MLTLKNIEVKFDSPIIDKTDLMIPEGKITLIRGKSGSGKSSLLYRIGLASNDTSYSYDFSNRHVDLKDDNVKSEIRCCDIAYVLQDNSLYEQYDVIGNMQLYALFHQKKLTKKECYEYLSMVNLKVPLHQSISTLSGGEKQRLAIACALCKDTPVILLDEPTSFLDEKNERIVFEILRSINKKTGKTIILCSHSRQAMEYADEILEIKDRKIQVLKNVSEQSYMYQVGKQKHISLNFYLSYIAYFVKKYKKFEIGLLALVTGVLLLINSMILYVGTMSQESISSYEKLSENQIYVYEDEEHTPFSFDEKISDATILPYYETIVYVNGMTYPVIPLYDVNHLENRLDDQWGNERVYISSGAYNQMLMGEDKPRTVDLQLIVRKPSGQAVVTDVSTPIGGVLENSVTSKYLKNECNFIYCDATILEQAWQEIGTFQQYQGYTLLFDTYDAYEAAVMKLSETKLVTIPFFEGFEGITNLKRIVNAVKTLITIIGTTIGTILFLFVELKYFYQRKKELLLLKMNGMSSNELLKLVTMEIIMQCLFAFVFNIFILSLINSIFSIQIQDVFFVSLIYTGVILICGAFGNRKFLHSLSAETVLRDNVV